MGCPPSFSAATEGPFRTASLSGNGDSWTATSSGMTCTNLWSFAINGSQPTPCSTSTTLRYRLPASTHVSLRVFDAQGGPVAVLRNAVEGAGAKAVTFDVSGLGSGVYHARLEAGGRVATERLVVVR